MGEVHPQVLKEFEIEQPVYICDLDISAIVDVAGKPVVFKELSRFPGVDRDSALLVDEQIEARRILDTARSARARDVEDVVLFDVYRGKGIPEGKKSIAIRVRYRRADKTLTDVEVAKSHSRIIKALENELGAEIR
jgi:phenylalanyl-tRNA synthetase beta chain